ncbi:helix-turn-helix domain-containing protein [Streptomyces spectabilis]|uniref:Transcriptional regulator with XRE-family HTH domain n=1 Tax=Streptomyces spectabilis TaxID=68270 RepID=A0A5P2X3F5_STRST|nr:helix-turn-helix transcriptional regulator [Streptomyces spectabilis]MBB5102961.1 transcriptional regulator with XRE-family HTH domain [Streptomyces spectabilis]MCI3902161.1 helix-turn-helix domain-containing protein [Streptomyces spectabilis]QEV59547.1 XRE family transcriptional regulator [Streptomyces spectabilis]GGV15627.1 transcriptional regulator [Streptomyces spectabilis]
METTTATGGVDEPGWDVDPDDEIASVVEALGHQQKRWREAAGLGVAEFATAMGYGEDQVRKVERGARIPRPEYLDRADEVLGANGFISAMKEQMAKARYPKKVRELAKLEERAVELSLYSNHNIHGLLQTEEFAWALLSTWRPALSKSELERAVAARVARQSVFERSPAPELSFVQEEVTLRRPIGDTMVLRRQLERLLEVGQLSNVELQVMPTLRGNHPGTAGLIEVLKFGDGTAIGRSEGAFASRPVSSPRQLRVLELRYGIIRAQALPPGESLAFIEQVLGET